MSSIKQWKKFLPIIFLAAIVVSLYAPLLRGFFEQDEWAVFADMIVFDHLPFFQKMQVLFRSSGIFSHFIPFTTLISYSMYLLFQKQYVWYATASIIGHLLNTFLVYSITKKLTNHTVSSLVAGCIFGIHKVSSQVVLWIAASVGAQLSTFFFLGSALVFLYYLERKKDILFFSSLILFVLSFLSKETTVSLILFYPLMYVFTVKDTFNKKKLFLDKTIRKMTWYAFALIGVFLVKYILLVAIPHPHPVSVANASFSPYAVAIRLVQYPLEALSQTFDAQGTIFALSHLFLVSQYPRLAASSLGPQLVETVGADTVSLVLSVVILCVIIGILYSIGHGEGRLKKLFVVAFLCFFASIVPYVGLPKFSAFLEQRYYYTPNIFLSMSVAFFFLLLWRMWSALWARGVLVSLIVFFIYTNYLPIHRELQEKVDLGNVRKDILLQMKHLLPRLTSRRTVVFVTGDGSDYLIPDLKVPFQSGFGNVLMVWYFDDKTFPPALLDDGYLYQLDDQGHREEEGTGFGYYFQKQRLFQALAEHSFPIEDVQAFFWRAKEKKLISITDEIRHQWENRAHENI